jgi:putative peptide zinc metalloprotease protein
MSVNRFKWVPILAVALALTAPGSASAGGANHVVQVSAAAGNSTAIRTDVQWAPFGGPSATSANIASAASSDCTGCRAVAVAFQAVVLTGDPNVVTPANAAVAVNGGCTGCDTFAFAYQDVVMTSGPASLSPAGVAALKSIQQRADAVARSGEPDAQMEADLKGLAAEFRADFESNLVLHGPAAASDRVDVQTAG